MHIHILFESEHIRFSEFTEGECKRYQLTVTDWCLNDLLEDALREDYDIVEDYISFDDVNNSTRTAHHYNSNLDCEKMLRALRDFEKSEYWNTRSGLFGRTGSD